MAPVICHKFLSVLLKKADGKDCYPTQVTESKVSKVGIHSTLILTHHALDSHLWHSIYLLKFVFRSFVFKVAFFVQEFPIKTLTHSIT